MNLKILIFILLIIIYLYFLIKNNRKLTKDIEVAEDKLLDVVEFELGQDKLNSLMDSRVWIGMPMLLFYYSHGRPDKTEKRSTPTTEYRTFFYDPIPNARSNARRKYRKEYYIENGILTNFDIIK